MATSIPERLANELKDAMRSGDDVRRDAIRMVRAAIKNEEIERRHPLDDDEAAQVVSRLAKRHRESIEQFTKGGRLDLAQREEAQLAVVESYLPTLMPREAVEAEVKAVMASMDVSGPRAQGAVMAALAPRLRGKADMKVVSEIVRAEIAAGSAGPS